MRKQNDEAMKDIIRCAQLELKGDIENLYCGKCGWHDRKDIELVTRERE